MARVLRSQPLIGFEGFIMANPFPTAPPLHQEHPPTPATSYCHAWAAAMAFLTNGHHLAILPVPLRTLEYSFPVNLIIRF